MTLNRVFASWEADQLKRWEPVLVGGEVLRAERLGECASRTALSSLRDEAASHLHPSGFNRISQERGA